MENGGVHDACVPVNGFATCFGNEMRRVALWWCSSGDLKYKLESKYTVASTVNWHKHNGTENGVKIIRLFRSQFNRPDAAFIPVSSSPIPFYKYKCDWMNEISGTHLFGDEKPQQQQQQPIARRIHFGRRTANVLCMYELRAIKANRCLSRKTPKSFDTYYVVRRRVSMPWEFRYVYIFIQRPIHQTKLARPIQLCHYSKCRHIVRSTHTRHTPRHTYIIHQNKKNSEFQPTYTPIHKQHTLLLRQSLS